jgi:hypothetical protein
MDWNVQCDTQAAQVLAATTSDLTLVTLSATLKARTFGPPTCRVFVPRGHWVRC